jgi:hypothetical protein
MYQVAMTTKYCTVAPNICGSLVWNLLNVISATGPTRGSICFKRITVNSFEHVFTYHQEVLYVQHLVYFMCIMQQGRI